MIRTLFITGFALSTFLLAYMAASVIIPEYMIRQCRAFDYNDHYRFTWDYWQKQCSALMQ